VIQIFGALSTSTYATVMLMDGARPENVYWKIEGAVGINNYSDFSGTIVCNNGALGALNTGVTLHGRALTTTGALTTTAVNVIATLVPLDCGIVGIPSQGSANSNDAFTIAPNPFSASTTLIVNDASQIINCQMRIYNLMGTEVMSEIITRQNTTLETSNLPAGIYFYRITAGNKTVQSGKLVSQQ
jgi:hypothetical protein